MTVIAIPRDHAVLFAIERRLEPDRDRFLANIEVAEATDETQAVKLARFFLEAANQQHLLVEFEQFLLRRLIGLRLIGPRTVGNWGLAFGARWGFCHDGETSFPWGRKGGL